MNCDVAHLGKDNNAAQRFSSAVKATGVKISAEQVFQPELNTVFCRPGRTPERREGPRLSGLGRCRFPIEDGWRRWENRGKRITTELPMRIILCLRQSRIGTESSRARRIWLQIALGIAIESAVE
jgi:hypothetical protein